MTKRLILLSAALMLGSSSGALAASCDINPTTPVYAPDNSAISIIFDLFFADPSEAGTCNINIKANEDGSNDPDEFRVYRADYQGFLEDGEKVTFKATQNGRTSEAVINGPKDTGDDYYHHYIGKDEDGKIRSKLRVSQDEGTGTFIDTLDYTLQGTMTRAQAEASLVSLGNAQTAMITHLDATSGLLTGGNMTLEGANEVRVLGGVGSYMLGGNVRYNLSDGFSLLAGVSLIDQGAGGASYTGGLGALALRYVEPVGASQRFFGEAGVNAGVFNMHFSRTYTDSTGTQTVTGAGNGALGALYVKGGVLFELDESNEIALSASARQSFLGLGDYREAVSSGNLFAADLSGQVAGFTTVKLGADWTTAVTEELDFTAHLGVGTTMANQQTTAYVLGGGDVTGGYTNTVFAEYGASLAWHVTSDSTIEGFVQGSTGTNIGTHAQVGAAYRMKF